MMSRLRWYELDKDRRRGKTGKEFFKHRVATTYREIGFPESRGIGTMKPTQSMAFLSC